MMEAVNLLKKLEIVEILEAIKGLLMAIFKVKTICVELAENNGILFIISELETYVAS